MLSQNTIDEVIAWAAETRTGTPAFLFAPATVRAAVARLRRVFPGRISYAAKANAHPLMLSELVPLVDEFNVTNTGHLDALLALGVAPARIAFVHPACSAETVDTVAARGVTRFVVDDVRGLRLLGGVAGRRGFTPRVTLRLKPPDSGESTRSVVRFGNTAEVLRDLADEAAAAGMDLEALSFFVGTSGAGLPEALPYRRGIERLAALREDLGRAGHTVPTVNVGGGFPGAMRPFHQRHPDFFRRIADAMAEHFAADVDVLCEPGRYLSEPSFTMLTRVIADRTVDGRRLVYLDVGGYGGLFETSFISPGGADLHMGLGRPRHRSGARSTAEVLGPIMDSFDVVKRNAPLPPLAEGDLLLLPDTGAYAWGYAAHCEGTRAPQVLRLPARLDAAFADGLAGEPAAMTASATAGTGGP
jgi:diaminopimelate decarboxylase